MKKGRPLTNQVLGYALRKCSVGGQNTEECSVRGQNTEEVGGQNTEGGELWFWKYLAVPFTMLSPNLLASVIPTQGGTFPQDVEKQSLKQQGFDEEKTSID